LRRAVGRRHVGAGVQAADPVDPLVAVAAQQGQVEEAQVGQAQRPFRQGAVRQRTFQVVGAAVQKRQLLQAAAGQLQAQLHLTGGGAVAGVAAAAAGQQRGQRGGQGNGRAVEDVGTPEAAQQGQGQAGGGEGALQGLAQDVLQAGGGLGGEALVEPLAGDAGIQGRGDIAQVVQSGAGVIEPAEGHGLHEGRPAELAPAADEAGVGGGRVGAGGE